MKAKFTFLAIALAVLLCLPAAVLAQQTIKLPPNAVNGGEKLVLDSPTRLGITPAALQEISAALARSATIELLKPADSTAQPKDLVITKVSWGREVLHTEIHELHIGPKTVLVGDLVGDSEHRVSYIIKGQPEPILIVLHNTTKSRIDLQGWQLRVTPGAIPDETDRVIDRMSSVNIDFAASFWLVIPDETLTEGLTQETVLMPHKFSISREIDYASLNDPGMTRTEQLRGIPDGIDAESWNASSGFEAEMVKMHNGLVNGWIELRSITDEPIDFKKWIRVVRPKADGTFIEDR